MTDTYKSFGGFSDPTQNWSRLPHQLIGALPLVSSLGEMKVILYVLRHTWGFHDNDKRISTDEFCNGRKHSFRYKQKHPDESDRLDKGTGMSKAAVLRGIERAVEHGFIIVETDDSDRGRIKKYYRLTQPSDFHPDVSKRDMSQNETPKTTKQDSTDPETIHQSKKETIERNQEKEPPLAAIPSGPSSDLDDQQAGITDVPEPDAPDDIAETEAMFKTPPPREKRTAEQAKAGIGRAIRTFEKNGGRAGVADPTQTCNPFLEAVDEFYHRFKPGLENAQHLDAKTRTNCARQIEKLSKAGAKNLGLSTADLAQRAFELMEPLSIMEKWLIKSSTSPFMSSWEEAFKTLMAVGPTVARTYVREDDQRKGGPSTARNEPNSDGFRTVPKGRIR